MQHGDGLFEKARGDRTNKLRHSLSLHHGAELVVAVHPFSPGNFVLFKKVSRHAELQIKLQNKTDPEEPPLPSYTMPHALDIIIDK